MLLHFLVVILVSVNGQLSVIWNGSLVTGPELIFLDELLVDDYRTSTVGSTNRPGALVCRSEDTARVSWHFVNGSIVSDAPRTDSRAIIQTRTKPEVIPSISRLSLSMERYVSSDSHISGIWHCRLNAMGDASYEKEINIGIFSRESGLGGLALEGSGVSLSPLPSSIPLNFTLYGDSVGGPPTNYFWSRNGEVISNRDGPYDISIGLNEASSDAYSRSVYRSTLTVTGDLPGYYAYHFTNRVSLQLVINNTEIQRGTPPILVEVWQNGQLFLDVTWTANAPLPQFGFEVTVQPGDFSVIAELADAPVSFSINGSVGEFRAEVRALFYPLPSETVGANTTVLGRLPAVVTELVVNGTEVRAMWSQPQFSLAISRYIVRLERATGSEQAICPDVQDNRFFILNFSATFNGLHEFSLYRIIISFSSEESLSTIVAFTTDSNVPTGVPSNVTATAASRSVSVSWDAIECIERNGIIINYIVEFGEAVSGTPVSGEVMNQTFIARGLTPQLEYTFRVAGNNSAGQGPFSSSVTITTNQYIPIFLSSLMAEVMFDSVLITWRVPQEPNEDIIAYEVSYTVNSSSITTINTTNTTLTLRLDLSTTVSNISVRAYTSGPEPAAVHSDVATPDRPIPAAVTGVMLEELGTTSVNVSWEGVTVSGVVNYTVYYGPRDEAALGSQSEQSVTVPSSKSSAAIEDLMPGVEYQFQVAAIAELEGRFFPGVRSLPMILLIEDIPGVVENLTADVIFDSVLITWRVPLETNGVLIAYEVSYTVNSSSITTINTTNTTLTLRLDLSTTVSNISVRAYTSVGPGPAALHPNVSTPDRPWPSAVSRVMVVVLDDTSVMVSWESSLIPEVVNYTVYYRPADDEVMGNESEEAVTVSSMENSVVIEDLVTSLEYQFQVAATAELAGRLFHGERSSPMILLVEDTPSVVLNLTTEVLFDSVLITWRVPLETNGVLIVYEVSYTVNSSSITTINTTNMTLTLHLDLSTIVSNISVRAYTSVGPGPAALHPNVSTPDRPRPAAVSGVMVEMLDDTSVMVSWEIFLIPEIVNYTVYYRPADAEVESEEAVTVSSMENSVVIEDLMIDVEYQFQVAAIAELEGRLFPGERSAPAAVPTTPPTRSPITPASLLNGLRATAKSTLSGEGRTRNVWITPLMIFTALVLFAASVPAVALVMIGNKSAHLCSKRESRKTISEDQGDL